MAHEVENMFSVSTIPWHKLGIILPGAPTIEEGILAAGLNWEVGTKPLQTLDGEMVTHQATYRKTDGKILGVVGPGYHVLQNREAFNFFQPFLDSKLATLETAGSLRDGKRVWVLAKLNLDPSVIKGNDIINKFVLLSNSHDGTLAVRVGFQPIRVVCNNTLQMALNSGSSQLIRVQHSKNVVTNLESVRETMNLVNQQFETTAEGYRMLANKQINSADLEKYIKIVFATPKQLKESENTDDLKSGTKVMGQIVQLFEKGRGNDMPEIKGTYWSAYNAVSEFVQYNRGEDDVKRLDSLWFGEGAQINKRALQTAIAMAA